MINEAYIVKGYRSAVGKAGRGAFRFTRPDDLATQVITYLLANLPDFDPAVIDDLIVGNAVPEAEQGLQIGRMIAVQCLPMHVSGMTINRYCGSGLEAIAIATSKIRTGMADCIVAGGTESMSLVPTVGWKTAPNFQVAKNTPDYYLSMGLTAEEVAVDYKVSREDQDTFALSSHEKAVKALDSGVFKEQIAPINIEETVFADGAKKVKSYVVSEDEGPRRDTGMEVLSSLKPAFAQNGTVTAGNSSQTSDGAAFVLLMSEKLLKEHKMEPIARLLSCASAGVHPRIMGIGPVEAVPKALNKASLKLPDIDLIELNEAFASQALAVIRALDLNPEIVNINGGAISLGHPLGCTGAKLTVQIINDLKRQKSKYGLVTACIGGGQGIAGIIECV